MMNLNSRIFDRIRVKTEPKPVPVEEAARCEHSGCARPGEHRAPMGRDREGQYFCFCIEHVREYNAKYNYFNGMTDDAMAKYHKAALTGHRPTWTMGMNRAAGTYREDGVDPAYAFRDLTGRARRGRALREPAQPRYNKAAMQALDRLGLDDSADAPAIKTRYKDMVKRLHPDANGGDRSSEDKLREIIRAYKYLRTAKLV